MRPVPIKSVSHWENLKGRLSLVCGKTNAPCPTYRQFFAAGALFQLLKLLRIKVSTENQLMVELRNFQEHQISKDRLLRQSRQTNALLFSLLWLNFLLIKVQLKKELELTNQQIDFI